MSETIERNKEILGKVLTAFNERRLEELDAYICPAFVGHNPLSPEPIPGPEGLKGFFGAFIAGMPDCRHPVWKMIAEGEYVAIHMPFEGTFENELLGIPPNGNKVNVMMSNIWRFEDGKIVELWLNMDTLGLMKQVGVVPA